MTERPIPFRDWEVRAILEGSKTQTRRKMKPQPKPTPADYPAPAGHLWPSKLHHSMLHVEQEMQKWNGLAGSACPYGAPGDTLWVRETWGRTTNVNDSPSWPGRAHIPMAGGEVVIFAADGHWQWCDGDGFATERSMWRPSIHMPRWASRITLEVKIVRVERLQDISEDDAESEGLTRVIAPNGHVTWQIPDLLGGQTPVRAFRVLWNHINGPGAWEANPWVWVISFERVKP